MEAEDIGFFTELKGVLANKRQVTRGKAAPKLKEGGSGKKRQKTSAGVLDLLVTQVSPNPCQGCPYEPKSKVLAPVGNPNTAKLLVIVERVSEIDVLNQTLADSTKYRTFWPMLQAQGFGPDDVLWSALTRCPGLENLDAVQHCVEYLRQDIDRPNIKTVLILGLRPFQLLLDKKRKTIFYARGEVFDLLGKPCLVTFADVD